VEILLQKRIFSNLLVIRKILNEKKKPFNCGTESNMFSLKLSSVNNEKPRKSNSLAVLIAVSFKLRDASFAF
jgi:hypothetical protein